MEKKINQVVGASFEELDTEDMKQTQGAGDVDAETTPVVLSATVSKVSCVSVILTRKKC
jgi:type 2 lantibiotic (TIGR03893 family)